MCHKDAASEFIGNTDADKQEIVSADTAKLIGTWGDSGLGYSGQSKYSNSPSAYATWTFSPKESKQYSVQFYSVVHNGASTATPSTKNAHVIVHIPGKGTHTYTFDQCNGKMGWYHLLHADLTPEDKIYVYLSNEGSGTLRACAVRLVPSDKDAVYVGNFDESAQELHRFETATTNGNWLVSSIGTYSYYGDKNSSAIWNIAPASSQKYAVQIYIPTTTVNNNSTQEADVRLMVDGAPYYYTLNERVDTNANTGWYDLAVLDLKPTSEIEIRISDRTTGLLRAGCVRLVPYPNKPYATKSENVVTLYAGTLSHYQNTFLFAEYDGNGKLVNVTNLPALPKQTITLNNNNTFKCFFWEENGTFSPITQYVE